MSLLPMSSQQTARRLELGREKECPFVSSRLLLLLKKLLVVSTLWLGAQFNKSMERIIGLRIAATHTRPESDNLVDQGSEIAQADPNNRKELTKTEIVHL